MVAISESPSDLESSDDGEDGDVEDDEETEQGKMSKDHEPGWVMFTITKTVQHRLWKFLQNQMKPDELTQPGWEDTANYFPERDREYGTSKLSVPAVVQQQTDDDAAAPARTSFGEHMECVDIVPRLSQMPQETSGPGSSHIRLGSVKLQLNRSIPGSAPAVERNVSPSLKVKPVETVSLYPCI